MAAPVLVTGGAGFVGGHMTRALLQRGRAVVVLDPAAHLPPHVLEVADGDQLVHMRESVMEPGALVEALTAHGSMDVVHAAALLGEPESLRRPREFLRMNAEAVWDLCDIARHLPLRRILTVSTRSVYGRYAREEGPLHEESPPRPAGFYGAGKAAADLAVIAFREHYPIDVVSARITGVYGLGQRYPTLLSRMVDAALTDQPFRLVAGADQVIEYTYVKDTVRGLLALLDAENLRYPVYNVSSSAEHSLTEVAAALRHALPAAELELGPGESPGDLPRAQLCTERLAAETGFAPRWSLTEGVADWVAARLAGSYGAPVE